ncbi:beta-ketoacyl-ACP synthase III [Candidatus Albibeggiatoa sp. nov. BB20]|uniref:beta-ketoacyl-ACP synthase III n=1 Tax=Candidatus Albibeggiatoa sp. nov. BB20 TaxID=3162723 RepID=UPI00336568DA
MYQGKEGQYAKIIGTGGYLPEKILTNADIEKIVDTNDEWIVERTGIKQRHIAGENESTCDMAEHAARQALEMAQCQPEDIDLIILATTTPDRIYPSTACLLQERLGCIGAPAFDVQAVCSGFVYALTIAEKFIKTGSAKRALVVGAETYSRILDWKDRGTCVLFGDGAGAVVLEASAEPGIFSTHLHADGRHKDILTVGGQVNQGEIVGSGFTVMNGTEVFKFAVTQLSKVVKEALAENNMQADEIDWFIPHQANMRIISATAKKLHFPMEKVVTTVSEHGNTSAASVPLALNIAVRDGRVKKGQTLLLEAIGGGFTWGAVLLKF